MNNLYNIAVIAFGLIFSGSIIIPIGLTVFMATDYKDHRALGAFSFGVAIFIIGLGANP